MSFSIDDMRALDLEFNTGYTTRELQRDADFANASNAAPATVRAWFTQYALEQDAETAEANRNDA